MRIKNVTSLFLALMLLISNFGLAFNVHYCGDEIASFSSVFETVQLQLKQESTKDNCCCIQIENKKDSCCKDKVVDLKKESKEVTTKTFSYHIQAPFIPAVQKELIFAKAENNAATSNETAYYCSPNAPPLFKLYQQYIFYA